MLSDDPVAGARAAAEADATIIVVGATTGEGFDRSTLALDNDAFVPAVADAARSTVVLVQAPGAVLLPWP